MNKHVKTGSSKEKTRSNKIRLNHWQSSQLIQNDIQSDIITMLHARKQNVNQIGNQHKEDEIATLNLTSSSTGNYSSEKLPVRYVTAQLVRI